MITVINTVMLYVYNVVLVDGDTNTVTVDCVSVCCCVKKKVQGCCAEGDTVDFSMMLLCSLIAPAKKMKCYYGEF